MSKGGELVQGQRGGPIPVGYGRSVVRGISDFATPQKDAVKWRNFAVAGVTKDSTGTILGGCNVDVFMSQMPGMPRSLVGGTVSDPVTGDYKVFVNGPDTGMMFEAVAYKAGSPDVAGVTVNTLVGVEL